LLLRHLKIGNGMGIIAHEQSTYCVHCDYIGASHHDSHGWIDNPGTHRAVDHAPLPVNYHKVRLAGQAQVYDMAIDLPRNMGQAMLAVDIALLVVQVAGKDANEVLHTQGDTR
jgi:hypothetical protein